LVPVAPIKSTVTTSPGSAIGFVLEMLIDVLPARLGKFLEVYLCPALRGYPETFSHCLPRDQAASLR
jgi:hypothetical protein